MTRWLDSSILADSETVNRIGIGYPEGDKPTARCLGKFQPYGMESSLDVFQVSPNGVLSSQNLQIFERALVSFQAGEWSLTIKELAELSPDDSASQFMSAFMKQYSGLPPEDWDGVVRMQVK